MTAIIDYDTGNIRSVENALKRLGAEYVLSSDKSVLDSCERLILPGVGEAAWAMAKLRDRGLDGFVRSCTKPVFGICLGMQLLFEKSFEYGVHEGLGLIEGSVKPLSEYISGLKIPHMCWNSLHFENKCPIFKYTNEGDYVYFVHSYFGICENKDELVAVTDYGMPVTAAVARENIYGTQFHPEKSGDTGLKILKAFSELAR